MVPSDPAGAAGPGGLLEERGESHTRLPVSLSERSLPPADAGGVSRRVSPAGSAAPLATHSRCSHWSVSLPNLTFLYAVALLGFFESLCGSRAKEINVRRREHFRFDPKQLLRGLSQLMSLVLSADEGAFYAALSLHQDLELGALSRMAQLMREEGVPWTDSCLKLVERLVSAWFQFRCVYIACV